MTMARGGLWRTVIGMVLFCLCSAQFSNAQSDQPNLKTTLAFMDTSVQPEMSSVSSAGDPPCEVYIVRNRPYTFGLPKETHIVGTNAAGSPQYGFTWAMVNDSPRVMKFDLSIIDPGSIYSKPVPSAAFLSTHNLDQHPWELNGADLLIVSFSTTNSIGAIESGTFAIAADGSASPTFDHQSSMGFLIFESKDRAERFVTAFSHAVSLCGGKTGDFAPTPSRR